MEDCEELSKGGIRRVIVLVISYSFKTAAAEVRSLVEPRGLQQFRPASQSSFCYQTLLFAQRTNAEPNKSAHSASE